MVTLKKIAKIHGMECMLHEKPFAGVNGSGKHCNYSFGNGSQGNLLYPGETPHKNAQFLVFCAAIIRGVHKYAKVLRAVIASAGNDHRLGANEAPPAIISVFLGEQLADVFEQIQKGGATSSKNAGVMNIGVDALPNLPKDAGDRNRTSPFAFTGNRFEFRAVGSDQSISGPLVAMNTIFAESIDYVATELENATGGDSSKLNTAVQDVIKKIMDDHGSIIFNGDNYTDAWQEEAAKRGLPNLKTTPEALPVLIEDDVLELFSKYSVLSKDEMKSRYETYLEQYILKVGVEAKTAAKMANTIIYPAAVRYQTELADSCLKMKDIGVDCDDSVLIETAGLIKDLKAGIKELEYLMAHEEDDPLSEAKACCEKILPTMLTIREAADKLEGVVADALWTLPTYPEMLFIR
jgi:glutamine synthetase